MDDLLAVGGSLTFILGVAGLFFLKDAKGVEWYRSYAGFFLCWALIGKGLANLFRAPGYSADYWRILAYMGSFSDMVFGAFMLIFVLIFPTPLMRSRRQFFLCIWVVLAMESILFSLSFVEGSAGKWYRGISYYTICGFIWTFIYFKFRYTQPDKRTEKTENIADAAILMCLFFFGHIWFRWVGFWTQSDYFYFMSISPVDGGANFMWSQSLAASIIVAVAMFASELYLTSQGRTRKVAFILYAYIALGFINHIILRDTSVITVAGGGQAVNLGSDYTDFMVVWNALTAQTHFTLMRPMICLYILFKFDLVNLQSRNDKTTKLVAIILIVVMTSALLELLQSVLPISELVSASLLAVVIAFGIGWEEKSFANLTSNRNEFPVDTHPELYPQLDIDLADHANRLNIGFSMMVGFLLLVSFVLHMIRY